MSENAASNGDRSATELPKAKWTVMVYLAGDNNLTPNCITVLQQLEAAGYKNQDDVCVLACFDSNTPWPKGSRYLAINGKRRMNDEYLDWEIYNDLIIVERRGHDITAPDFCGSAEIKAGERPKQPASQMKTDVALGLKRFLKWATTQRKADHYMLVLYGHGPLVAGNTFLGQDNPVSAVSMKDLPDILQSFGGQKVDILAFQNCAMNGIETAYEVRNQVDYMIGSQGLVLSYGWPYDKMIRTVIEHPDDPPVKIAEKILKACARHLIDFSVMDRSSEQSACDLSKLADGSKIMGAVQKLSATLQDALAFDDVPKPTDSTNGKGDDKQKVLRYPIICDAVRLARLEAQSYWGETFVDLFDFCERLLLKCQRTIIAQKDLITSLGLDDTWQARLGETKFVETLSNIMASCKNVRESVLDMVPYSYYIGAELQYSRGLSIYFPWTMPREPYTFKEVNEQEHILESAFETYSGYAFCTESGWPNFLRSFYSATLRNVRRADREVSVVDVKDRSSIPVTPPINVGGGAISDTVTIPEGVAVGDIQFINDSLSTGMVHEDFTPIDYILTTDYLQKTDSNSGGDVDDWSKIKNYPRRNYLSPSDCARKIPQGGRFKVGDVPVYPNSRSTPVSYLGWNICQFVADVIVKKSNNDGDGKP